MALSPSARRRLGRVLRLLPLVLLAVALGRSRAWEVSLGDVSWVPLLLVGGLNLCVYLPLRAYRWGFALHEPPGFWHRFFALLEGFLAGAALGFGSADAVRSARLRRHGRGRFASDFGSTMAERGSEFVALAIILFAASSLGAVGSWAMGVSLLAISAYLVALLLGGRSVQWLRRWPRVTEGLSSTLRASKPQTVIWMIALSLLAWSVEIGMILLTLDAFGLPSEVGTGALVLLGINLAIAIPGPPANLGTFEAGIVTALALRGVATAPALAFGMVYHLLVAIPVNLVGAVVYAVRERTRPA